MRNQANPWLTSNLLAARSRHAAGAPADRRAALLHRLGLHLQLHRPRAGRPQVGRMELGRASTISSGCSPATVSSSRSGPRSSSSSSRPLSASRCSASCSPRRCAAAARRSADVVEVCIMLGWLLPDIVAAFLWSATTVADRADQLADHRAARLPAGQLHQRIRAAGRHHRQYLEGHRLVLPAVLGGARLGLARGRRGGQGRWRHAVPAHLAGRSCRSSGRTSPPTCCSSPSGPSPISR